MTRSVPLMMNVARSDMSGISPKKTSCSLTSRMVRARLLVHVEDHQLDRHLDGGGVRHTALAALLFRPLQIADRVGEKFEGGAAVVVGDGEDPLEYGLEPHVPAFFRGDVRLEELGVRLLLEPV